MYLVCSSRMFVRSHGELPLKHILCTCFPLMLCFWDLKAIEQQLKCCELPQFFDWLYLYHMCLPIEIVV